MFGLDGWDIILLFVLFLMLEHLIEKVLLFFTAKAAIKQAGILGTTKEEIMKETTKIVNAATEEAQKLILEKAKKVAKDEVIRIVDAENKNIALTLEKNKKK